MARTEEQWVNIISALLKKAEKTDSEAEAETFFRQANEFMLKHAIDEARVREATIDRSRIEEPVQSYWMYATHDAHAKAKEVLVDQIAQSMHVRFRAFPNKKDSNRFQEGNEGRYSQWGSLVGFASDIEGVKVMFASLMIQWTRFVRADVKARRLDPDWGQVGEYGFKTGHLEGFAYRVGERMRQQEKDFLAMASDGNALMINKDQQIEDWYNKKHGIIVREYCWAIEPRDQRPRKNSRARYCIIDVLTHPDGKDHEHKYTYKPDLTGYGSRKRDTDSSGYYAGQAAANVASLGGPKNLKG